VQRLELEDQRYDADQRDAEREIYRRLVDTDFAVDCYLWRCLADRLARYGYGVLVGWGLDGVLRSRADAKHIAGSSRIPEHLHLDEDQAKSLAQEVLSVSIDRYRRISLPAWDPNGGASLRTWLIGRCLLDLPDTFERWHRHERRQLPAGPPRVDDGRHGHRPDEEAEAHVLLEQALGLINDPVARTALAMQNEGHTVHEIAQQLQTTDHIIRTALYRARARIRKELEN
jgi:DNA-directed RNA polymerase specialized sigma24 family protein